MGLGFARCGQSPEAVAEHLVATDLQSPMEATYTETLKFVVADAELPLVREQIAELGRELGLRFESIQERDERFGKTRLEVTTTGPVNRISDFEEAFAGDAWGSADHSPADAVVSSALSWAQRTFRRRRRARRARNARDSE